MTPARENLTVDEVTFAVRRSARRRTIGISIPPEGAPVVAAPSRCSRPTLEAAVRGKLAWVRRKLGERDALAQLPPHRYEAGERFPYLGDECELVVVDDAAATGRRGAPPGDRQLAFDVTGGVDDHEPLRLRDGRFELAQWARADGRRHFLAWYRRRATDVLNERVAYWTSLVGVALPPVAVKDMRSRWGSCSAKGRISLHWGLVVLPPELADYVVVHELVHLRELNHGPAFWRGVERIVPDYRERRKRLRAEGPRTVV